ncbi:stage II sporulation protein R [Lachnotalea glycerini]|uniref:Stage II sporulation protein R n=1 Tax=Lachnotalea glycerini TaxID=1763509 RepID=A0A318EM50_9FIRM|nr:stage II sporulation protein R [Lachnotalea glycerini]PXV90259.1 stage II sporulation protein R [Lachnotalea glycerini]
MKKIKKVFIIFTILVTGIVIVDQMGFSQANYKGTYNQTEEDELQNSLAQKIIRFHVIADNDSDASQNLKLKVKDKTLDYMKNLLHGDEDLDATRKILEENLLNIENFALEVVKSEGYEYNVSADFETCYFPIKEYGSLIFPAGDYEALRIKLGKAEGRNWWCVMYPNLCFVNGAYAVVSDEVKETLENMLTPDEYHMLLDGSKTRISFKYLNFLNQ